MSKKKETSKQSIISDLSPIFNMDTITASLLIFFTIVSTVGFFYKWVNLILIIIFGAGSFFFIKTLYAKK